MSCFLYEFSFDGYEAEFDSFDYFLLADLEVLFIEGECEEA